MEKLVGRYMVKSPYFAEESYTLNQALEIMNDCDIRHLPIVQDDKLIGLVSERDILQGLSQKNSENLKLKDIMRRDLFVARSSTSLATSVRYMQEQKIGSVLITNERRECIGIFTTIDALGILADILEEEDGDIDTYQLGEYSLYWDNAERLGV